MNRLFRGMFLVVAITGVSLIAAGCGGVSGHTYRSEGGAVQIEFQSGGKANVSMGMLKMACTYVEDSKSVTLTCERDKTVFTIKDEQLILPRGGMIGPLTRKK